MVKRKRGQVRARTTQSALNKVRRENSASFRKKYRLTVKKAYTTPERSGMYVFNVYAEKRKKSKKNKSRR
jgi:hypothetical protein